MTRRSGSSGECWTRHELPQSRSGGKRFNTLSNETVTAAFSLGNMVVLSALSDWNAHTEKHFMIDAAVPIEAIDGSAPTHPNMRHSAWEDYDRRVMASGWSSLFPPGDWRSTLTWSNRLANIPIANIYNFYSSGEEVLRTHYEATPSLLGLTESMILDSIYCRTPVSTYSWALQEKEKGCSPFDGILGSTHGGWRFNTSYNSGFDHLPPAQANQLPTSELQTNAFFNFDTWHNHAHPDLALEGANGSWYAEQYRDRILSDAIPALTLPVGANPVPILDILDHNFDMNFLHQSSWPVSRSSGPEAFCWHHSDVREVAYTFVHLLFNKLVTEGNVK